MDFFFKNILTFSWTCRLALLGRAIRNFFASILVLRAASLASHSFHSFHSFKARFLGSPFYKSIFRRVIFYYFLYCFFLIGFGAFFPVIVSSRKHAGDTGRKLLPLRLPSSALFAQSLWKDKNPYEPSVELPAGSILKLEVDEPIVIEYEYEDLRDRTKVLKLVPDKKLIKELPPVNTNHSIVNKNKSRLKSKSRVKFKIAVTVQETSNKNVIEFRGLKLIAQEGGKQRQQIQVTGRIARSDVKSGRLIRSSDVANLVIQITGAPVRVRENIPMKYDDKGKPFAKLSEAEKQRLLLDYLNRVLGEGKP